MNDGHIYILDLFSGIGGFALAAEIANAMADAGQLNTARSMQASPRTNGRRTAESSLFRPRFTSLAHSEIEPFACAVYHRHFPDSVCLGTVQNVTRDTLIERCGVLPDVVCGGFPCQPHSCAGKRLASADDRDLWGECGRILGELRPRFALFENVGGLLTSESGLFFNRVLSDLAALRFACQWQVVPASAVGAPHRRDRVWLLCWDELADADRPGRDTQRVQSGRNRQKCGGESGQFNTGNVSIPWPALDGHWPSRPGEPQHGWEPPRVVGNAAQQLLDGCGTITREAGRGELADAGVRQAQSSLGLCADGLPAAMGGDWPQVHNRVPQLKAAGNAILPECSAIFMYAIQKMLSNQERKVTNA